MRCPGCRRDVAASAAFCGACGTRIRRVCPVCERPNDPGNAFCEGCGRALEPVGADSAGRPSAVSAPELGDGAPALPEHRPLTVMFCDLVDSTRLAGHLDPEDLREVLDAYLQLCSGAVQGHGGRVAQLLGDGVLVYFGYPEAQEDDPVRAVDAALQILASLPRLNRELGERVGGLHPHRLSARIGVHTGPVVVSDMEAAGHRERLALGDTVNLAARLQTAAQADSVVISDATRELVRGAFELEDLGPQRLKGIVEPIAASRVVAARAVRHRLEGVAEAELTPLVGRGRELRMLLDRWPQVVGGRGGFVLIEGEAGIGKSRLLRVLRGRLSGAPHLWLEGRCSSSHRNSAFHPVIQLLRRALEIGPEEGPEEHAAKLARWADAGGLDPGEALPTLAHLLELELPESVPRSSLSPDVQRKRVLELLPQWLSGLARARPVVLVIEDLHWADPSTLELLGTYLGASGEGRAILLLGTCRPEFQPGWQPTAHDVLRLHPLSPGEVAELARNVARGKRLPSEIVAQVVEKTDGVPLFVEELTKNVLESDLLVEEDGLYRRSDREPDSVIPSTLQGSLMARLDRLGRAKEVAQLGAVVGREFDVGLLATVSPWPRPELERALGELERAGIVRRKDDAPSAVCVFRHALIQDTAYQSQLRRQRRQSHGRIARALEEQFPQVAESEPEVLARHWEMAGDLRKASASYERAGERALARSAHSEAVAHLRKGIALLERLDETAERVLRELSLQTRLGMALLTVRGYGNPEVEQACARSRVLCRGVGDGPQLAQSLGGLFIFYLTRGDLRLASELAEEYWRMAERLGGDYYPQWANLFGGMALHYRGHWEPALAHFEAGIALYDGPWSRPPGMVIQEDQGLACRCMGGQALWMLGRTDSGLARTQEAVEIARRSRDPNQRAFALVFSATMHQLRREPRRAREDASEVVAIAEQHRFPMWLGNARVFRGWARCEEGEGEQGLAEMVEGTTLLATTGARITGPQILGLLAEVYASLGRFEEAARPVEAGLHIARSQGLSFWDPELHRLRGELLLQGEAPRPAEAEACFRRSREIAEAQGAHSFALRTACSAARLLRAQGRRREAREWLAPVQTRLWEGQDTRDRRHAAELLAGLGASDAEAGSPPR